MHLRIMTIFYHKRMHHCETDTPTEGFTVLHAMYVLTLIEFLLKRDVHGIDISDFC